MTKMKANHFDGLLKDDGAAAIVLKRRLKSVEGEDGFIFPPTFGGKKSKEASKDSDDDEEGGGGEYQIDSLGDGRNVCLIDSVGSQANRMEPIFKVEPYSKLVPQIRIRLKEGDEVNLLDLGHRAADAVIRFSERHGPAVSKAFKLLRDERDCTELLKIAPTSLIFGVWDSRGTQVKVQRVVRSVIRAYNVQAIKRSATYRAAYDFVGKGAINPIHDKGKGKDNLLSKQGFKFSLATDTHGGVLVKGGIQQEAVINLVALRSISANSAVLRYLFGLSLVALSYRDQQAFNLREGCLLCAASPADFDGSWTVVGFNGLSKSFEALTHQESLDFAIETTNPETKGITVESSDSSDQFDHGTAEKWMALGEEARKAAKKKGKHPQDAVKEEANGSKRQKAEAKMEK